VRERDGESMGERGGWETKSEIGIQIVLG